MYEIPVKGGVKTSVVPEYEKEFAYLLMNGESISSVEKRLELPEVIDAPVEKGQVLGMLSYYCENRKMGEVSIIASEAVEKAGYLDVVWRVWLAWMM